MRELENSFSYRNSNYMNNRSTNRDITIIIFTIINLVEIITLLVAFTIILVGGEYSIILVGFFVQKTNRTDNQIMRIKTELDIIEKRNCTEIFVQLFWPF